MRDRTVIYDSEEDDDGFSPLNSPVKGRASQVQLTAENENEGQMVENHTEDSRSTDPDFFKRIYEEQQKAMADSVPNSVMDAQAQDGLSDKRKSSDSKAKNSSSITDPNLKSALKRINANEVENFTQVTTPSAPSAKPKDVYDFSLSDEEGVDERPAMVQKKVSSKGVMTVSKRKRDQSGVPVSIPATASRSSPPQDATSNFESPSLPSKKRKIVRDQSMRMVPDDVDLLAIPTSQIMTEPHDEANVEHGDLDSSIPDAQITQVANHANPPASFFIAPVTLTTSQKNEYLRIGGGGSSELDGEDDQQQMTALPDQKIGQRSTNTTESTIAYTTPSRFASSVEPLPILGASDGPSSNAATSSGRRTQLDRPHVPQSSPDELNANSKARATRGNRHMSAVDEEDELAHDSWNPDKSEIIRETRMAKSNRRGSRADQDHLGDTLSDTDTVNSGKKRKRDARVNTLHADSGEPDNLGFPSEHHVPRPSTRRSRVVAYKEEMQRVDDSMPDTCPPGNSSYKNSAGVGPIAVPSEWQKADEVVEGIAGADPEVWAALPDDIRQELMAQQQFARTSHASRTRRSGRGAEAASTLEPPPDEMAQTKKRGRKKKVKSIEEAPIAIDEAAAAFEELETLPSPVPTAAAKRKRGRPRKSEAAPPPSMIDEPSELTDAPERLVVGKEEQSATHALPVKSPADSKMPLKAPAKRGRKKKVVEAPSLDLQGLGEETAHLEEDGDDFDGLIGKRAVEPPQSPMDPPAVSIEIEDRPALRDMSSSASNMLLKSGSATDHVAEDLPTDEAEQQQKVTPEPKAKEVAKSASTPGPQGKVPLRVGLSKRSRIAPLLKIIRK